MSLNNEELRTSNDNPFNSQKSKIPGKFGPYLAGLIEADGSIAVHDKDSKVKKYRPQIIVVFSLADKPLAEKLAVLTQVGTVYDKKSAGCVLWQIQKKEDVKKIIHLINGYMRTPKIEALHRAINWFNQFDNCNIDCLDLDTSPIDSNGWLAGFTDGESGGFYLSITKRKTTSRFTTQFKLKINQVCPNSENGELIGRAYFSIFSKICEYLETTLMSRVDRSNIIRFLFIIIVHNPNSLDKVIEYFDKFPLLGKKALDFSGWREVILKIKNKEHLHPKGLEHIKRIKERLN
jgi:hypothetical protein